MKVIRVTEDFLNEEKTESIGSCYFESSIEDLSYCSMQINIRKPELLTEEIKNQIKGNFNDFIDTVSEYGWDEMLGRNEEVEK